MACKLVRFLSMTRRPVGEPSKLIVFRNSGRVLFSTHLFLSPRGLRRVVRAYTIVVRAITHERSFESTRNTRTWALIFINYLYRHEINILLLNKSRPNKKKKKNTHTHIHYLRTPTSNYLITSYAFRPVFKHQTR